MADLRVIEAEPAGPGIVELLESALKDARNGALSSVAIALVYRDGTSNWNWSEAPSASTLIGCIERMKADFIRATDKD